MRGFATVRIASQAWTAARPAAQRRALPSCCNATRGAIACRSLSTKPDFEQSTQPSSESASEPAPKPPAERDSQPSVPATEPTVEPPSEPFLEAQNVSERGWGSRKPASEVTESRSTPRREFAKMDRPNKWEAWKNAGWIQKHRRRPWEKAMNPSDRNWSEERPRHWWESKETRRQDPPKQPRKPRPLDEDLRGIMRLLTHPVVVVTARGKEHGPPRGMTLSSFTTLRLQPTPLITFNVATPSHALDAVLSDPEGLFNVHILTASRNGVVVAKAFAAGAGEAAAGFEELLRPGQSDDPGPPDLSHPQGRKGGVMCMLRCRLARDEVPEGGGVVRIQGDLRGQAIVIGEVLKIQHAKKSRPTALAYMDRQYRGSGNVLVNPNVGSSSTSEEGES